MSININTREVETLTKIDSADANTTYIGEAKIGSSESSAVWQITKILKSGNVTSILSANSNLRFNNAWTDRATLTYG